MEDKFLGWKSLPLAFFGFKNIITWHEKLCEGQARKMSQARQMLTHALLPVANEEDATYTAQGLAPYEPNHVTALYVVEKADGAPDKMPLEQAHDIAEESFSAIREVFTAMDEYVAYDRDVIAEIFAVADEVGASAIVFRPRQGNRLSRFLSGDLSLKLVLNADRPVIAPPQTNKLQDGA